MPQNTSFRVSPWNCSRETCRAVLVVWPPLNLRYIQKDVESLGFRVRRVRVRARVRVWVWVGSGLGLGTSLAIKKDFPRSKVRHNSASTLILGILVPAAGLQAKGNLRYLVVCGVFSFRAQMSQHTPILSQSYPRISVRGLGLTERSVGGSLHRLFLFG